MSITTEKPSLLETLKTQAADIAAKIKEETDKHLETLHLKLQDLHKQVQSVTAEIESHAGKPAGAKRGRKAGATKKATAKPAKAGRKVKGKRGAVGEAIQAYLATKGAKGAHVKEIAEAIGNKPANVTAYFYGGAGKKLAKPVAPATFALKK